MLKIGITGGIGSGKSTVSRIFQVIGVPVFDADARAKELMEVNESLKEQIIILFGKNAYASDKLNRAYISSIVFSNPEKLHQLNAIVHPATIADSNKWMQSQKSPYCIKEAALIFESGSDKELDGVIGVSAPEALRIQRVMQRDSIQETDVRKRINRQMNDAEKMKRCDWIIENDEHHSLIEQVLRLHQRFMEHLK